MLELLEDSEASHVSSIQDDLIPYLVDLQFRPLEEQPPTIQRHVDTWLERRDTASMSSRPVGTMPPPSPNDLVRCYAMVRHNAAERICMITFSVVGGDLISMYTEKWNA